MDFELSEEDLVEAGFPISDVIKTRFSVDDNDIFYIHDNCEYELIFTRNKQNGFTYTIPDDILFKHWRIEDSVYKRPFPAYIGMGHKSITFLYP